MNINSVFSILAICDYLNVNSKKLKFNSIKKFPSSDTFDIFSMCSIHLCHDYHIALYRYRTFSIGIEVSDKNR